MTKVSIIIPTYNRPSRLKRLLDYYKGYKVDYNIIVADASLSENKALNKETISSFPNLKILYLGDYSDKIRSLYKIVDAINYVKSKYCVFCADDDFVTPNGINQSVDFLEKNPDFTIAQGFCTHFCLKAKKRREKQFYWRIYHSSGRSLTFSDPEVRLVKHLSKYSATFYGVHRTDFLKMIFKEAIKYTDIEHFTELLTSALTLIHGKMKCLDVLYAARDIINPTERNSKSICELLREGSYDEEYTKFKNCLAIHLNKKSQLDMDSSKKVIDNAMSIFMKRFYSLNYKNLLANKVKYVLNGLHTPDWIYKKIRLLYQRLFLIRPKDTLFDPSNDDISFKYYDDFNRIRTQVFKFLKNEENDI